MFTDWLLCLEWVTEILQLDEMGVGFFCPSCKKQSKFQENKWGRGKFVIVIFRRALDIEVALAEWLRRVPAKYMGFPRESSNLSGDGRKENESDCKSFLLVIVFRLSEMTYKQVLTSLTIDGYHKSLLEYVMLLGKAIS